MHKSASTIGHEVGNEYFKSRVSNSDCIIACLTNCEIINSVLIWAWYDRNPFWGSPFNLDRLKWNVEVSDRDGGEMR
jgi:hypothetical protein